MKPETPQPAIYWAPEARNPRSPPTYGGDVKGLAQPPFPQAPDARRFDPASHPGEGVRAPIEAKGSHQYSFTYNVASETGKGFLSQQASFTEIKKARNQLWRETGYVPPIAGGEESPAAGKSGVNVPDGNIARKRIEEIFNTRWDRKTKEGKREYRKAVKELARLSKQYPDIYEQVYRSMINRITSAKD